MSESDFTQSGQVRVTSPSGRNEFILASLTGTEGLSQLYEFRLELLSNASDLLARNYLTKPMTVSLPIEGDAKRHFHGRITDFAFTGLRGRLFCYEVTLRPWLWLLGLSSDCKIHQSKSAPDIITGLFQELGFNEFRKRLSGTYEAREYCVQFHETHLDFVCRLMEDEGIYFYFEHQVGKSTLILADGLGSHDRLPANDTLEFRPGLANVRDREDCVFDWRPVSRIAVNRTVLQSYDFEKPRANLESRTAQSGDFVKLGERHEYDTRYRTIGAGSIRSRLQLESLNAGVDEARSWTVSRNHAVGGLFTLDGHPRNEQNREYLITSAAYALQASTPESGGSAGGDDEFRCDFTATPSTHPYRAPRVTPRPVIPGPQTARVVGKTGEDQWMDRYGRVKVQFHWDRVGAADENSSCWVRVAQVWAGKNWGTHFFPRLGQEVVVTFLEGDPDQPLITGSVYNNDVMPPYTLPDEQTKSGVKSRSTKEGTAENFNEIRFEDKKDEEEIYVHAEKNMNRVVENNDTLKVGFEKKDKGDQTVEVFNNQTVTVGHKDAEKGDQTITVFNNQTLSVGDSNAATGDQAITIYHNRTLTVGNDETVKVGFDRKDKGDQTIEVYNNQILKVGTSGADKGDQTITIFHDRTLDVGNDEKLTVKHDKTDDIKNNLKIKVGNECVVEATTSIELKVGASSIKIEGSKITLKSPEIAISGDGKIEVKSGGVGSVEASGPLTVKGAIVQIN